MMQLDYSSLRDALSQLESSLGYAVSDFAKMDDGLALQLRMAAIKAFEYSYEVSVKMLRRHLEEIADSPDQVDALAFRDMLRLAAEKHLLPDITPWIEYRELRNKTSHCYDVEIAVEVYRNIPDFLKNAQKLAQKMGAYAS